MTSCACCSTGSALITKTLHTSERFIAPIGITAFVPSNARPCNRISGIRIRASMVDSSSDFVRRMEQTWLISQVYLFLIILNLFHTLFPCCADVKYSYFILVILIIRGFETSNFDYPTINASTTLTMNFFLHGSINLSYADCFSKLLFQEAFKNFVHPGKKKKHLDVY